MAKCIQLRRLSAFQNIIRQTQTSHMAAVLGFAYYNYHLVKKTFSNNSSCAWPGSMVWNENILRFVKVTNMQQSCHNCPNYCLIVIISHNVWKWPTMIRMISVWFESDKNKRVKKTYSFLELVTSYYEKSIIQQIKLDTIGQLFNGDCILLSMCLVGFLKETFKSVNGIYTM